MTARFGRMGSFLVRVALVSGLTLGGAFSFPASRALACEGHGAPDANAAENQTPSKSQGAAHRGMTSQAEHCSCKGKATCPHHARNQSNRSNRGASGSTHSGSAGCSASSNGAGCSSAQPSGASEAVDSQT